jgi:hypothetical protein
MVKQKKFLILAIMLGIAGIVIGGITFLMALQDLILP